MKDKIKKNNIWENIDMFRNEVLKGLGVLVKTLEIKYEKKNDKYSPKLLLNFYGKANDMTKKVNYNRVKETLKGIGIIWNFEELKVNIFIDFSKSKLILSDIIDDKILLETNICDNLYLYKTVIEKKVVTFN